MRAKGKEQDVSSLIYRAAHHVSEALYSLLRFKKKYGSDEAGIFYL